LRPFANGARQQWSSFHERQIACRLVRARRHSPSGDKTCRVDRRFGHRTGGPWERCPQDVTIRWWSAQTAPAQLAAYCAQVATFEAAHPGVKVVIEPMSDDGYAAQLAAAFASKQVPNVVTHLPSSPLRTTGRRDCWNRSTMSSRPSAPIISMIASTRFSNYPRPVRGHRHRQYRGEYVLDPNRPDEKAAIDKIRPHGMSFVRRAERCRERNLRRPLPFAMNDETSLTLVSFIHLPRRGIHSRSRTFPRERRHRSCARFLQIDA